MYLRIEFEWIEQNSSKTEKISKTIADFKVDVDIKFYKNLFINRSNILCVDYDVIYFNKVGFHCFMNLCLRWEQIFLN